MQCGQCLGGSLGEHQDHERQNNRANRHSGFATDSEGDERDQGSRRKIDQIVAEQDQSDQPVRSLQKAFSDAGAPVSFARFVAKLIAVQTHQRRFRAGEKRGKQQQE